MDVDGVAGARLTGAGFGGCVIACLREDAVDAATEAIAKNYVSPTLPEGTAAVVWPVKISEGSHIDG
jgi:galactokinase